MKISKSGLIQQVVAGVASILLVFLLSLEEVHNGEAVLSALSVALASSTLFILGFVLLLGPMSRLYPVLSGLFQYRKEFGIMAFFTGLSHVYLVMFPLARHGPWGLFQSRPWSAYPGLEALGLMFLLLVLSFDVPMHALGTRAWVAVQYWGARLTFVLIAIHVIVLKYQTIMSWADPRNPKPDGPMPLVVWETLFIINVLLIRLSELFGRTFGKGMSVLVLLETVFAAVWLLLVR